MTEKSISWINLSHFLIAGWCCVTYSFSANWWRVSFCFHVFWKFLINYSYYTSSQFWQKLVPVVWTISFSIKKSSFSFMTYLWEESNQNALSFYFSVLTKVSWLHLAVQFFLNVLSECLLFQSILNLEEWKILSSIPAGIFLEPH